MLKRIKKKNIVEGTLEGIQGAQSPCIDASKWLQSEVVLT